MPITYLDAIREAQARALADDPRVFIYGQDVGSFGGAFKATKNLAQQFPGRVIDAPISEDAMMGMAVGAAIEGMRPIIEMQFADFSTVGFNQIVNQAATLHWRTRVPCPITVRLPAGGTSLKADQLPTEAMPVGKARIVRPGRDMTIVAYSAMLHEALAAAAEMSGEGTEIEVVDLRSIKPLDTDTVMASVARTGRLLCVGEAWPWGGVTAEVVARVATEGFGLLDAPPQRLNAKDTPVPYHPSLWAAHRPTARAIAAAARNLLRL